MSKEQKAEKNLKEENVDNLRKKINTLEKIHCDKCRSRHFFEQKKCDIFLNLTKKKQQTYAYIQFFLLKK